MSWTFSVFHILNIDFWQIFFHNFSSSHRGKKWFVEFLMSHKKRQLMKNFPFIQVAIWKTKKMHESFLTLQRMLRDIHELDTKVHNLATFYYYQKSPQFESDLPIGPFRLGSSMSSVQSAAACHMAWAKTAAPTWFTAELRYGRWSALNEASLSQTWTDQITK